MKHPLCIPRPPEREEMRDLPRAPRMIMEISHLLRKGKNAIGIILGNGFANQSVYHWDFGNADFRAPLSVSVELFAENGADKFGLVSDESFKTAPSPIIYDMYRYGTHYDATREISGWCDAEFDDSEWNNAEIAIPPRGEIVKCTAEPIKKIREIKPVSIKKVENFCYLKTAYRGGDDVEFSRVKSAYLYDFGENHSGACRLKINGGLGQKITLRHTERLDENGNFQQFTKLRGHGCHLPNVDTRPRNWDRIF